MDSNYTEKIPPHNLEAEQAVLGALLTDSKPMDEIMLILRPEKFYSLQNQLIFESIINLSKMGTTINLLSLKNDLNINGNLDKAGGISYISELTNLVPSSEGIKHWAQIVDDCYVRRQLINISLEARSSAFELNKPKEELLEATEKKIFALAENTEQTVIHSAQEMVTVEIESIMKRKNSNDKYTGIPSGFTKLDNYTSGFQNSELIVIGARPSIGKTALALSMMAHIAADLKVPCGFFSLEMPYESIGMRLVSMVSRVPLSRIKSGMLQSADIGKIQNACGSWFDAPFYIVDTPNMRLMELRAMARRMVSKNGVKIIFIDYIGLITTEDPTAKTYEAVAEISKSLKALARELRIPIVALSQVSRDAEGQDPNLAQIRGSGAVEQDADVVMFLNRERLKDEVEAQDAKIILAKQRNGACGDIPIMYLPMYTKFVNKVNDNE